MEVVSVAYKDLLRYLSAQRSREVIIDAESAVLGRLASLVAKLALMGFRIHVVNVEKAVISGDKKMVIESYKLLLEVETHKNPYRHSVKRPRNPVLIFKRAVKNMLPKDNWRGKEAYKAVRAYVGMPKEFEGRRAFRIEEARKALDKFITVYELAKMLGWNPRA